MSWLLSVEATAFLTRAPLAHLATSTVDGRPHVVPIAFVWLSERLWSALDAKPKRTPVERLRRVRNLQANPHVSVVVDRYDEDWSRLGYVLIEGTARLVEAAAADEEVLAALRAKYAAYRAGPLVLKRAPLIEVTPQHTIVWGRLDA